jgi:hypothetical protein
MGGPRLRIVSTAASHSHTTFNQLATTCASEKKKEVRKKRQRHKGHFTPLLSSQNSEMNILFGPVSTRKLNKKQNIY